MTPTISLAPSILVQDYVMRAGTISAQGAAHSPQGHGSQATAMPAWETLLHWPHAGNRAAQVRAQEPAQLSSQPQAWKDNSRNRAGL